MTAFDIILVPFPFADLTATKRRPCLVLASYTPKAMREHLVLAMMTSQVQGPKFPGDVSVSDFNAAGLPKPTVIRLCKIVTLDSELVVKRLGSLAKSDREVVRSSFGRLFNELSGA